MSAALLIHVGYPKTGTTWLQNNVFTRAALGFYSPWGARAGFAIDCFVRPNAFAFDAAAIARRFTDVLEAGHLRGCIPVLSEETLTGDPGSGRYWGKCVADRIAAALPEARILITLREQEALILSTYREYVLSGGSWSLQRFLGDVRGKAGFGGVLEPAELEYDHAVRYYRQLFGIDHVLINCIELLKSDSVEYVRRIQRFVGLEPTDIAIDATPSHRGSLALTLQLRRFGNRYSAKPDIMQDVYPLSWRLLQLSCRMADRILPVVAHDRGEARLRSLIHRFVGNRYIESNRRLDALLPPGELPTVYRR